MSNFKAKMLQIIFRLAHWRSLH